MHIRDSLLQLKIKNEKSTNTPQKAKIKADIKNSEAPVSTTTIYKNKVDAPTNNIYEAISIISKRANQINGDIKKELLEKLDEFATYNDSLEEVFENKEQIEVSKFYERLPKPTAMAVEEWLNEKIYHRNTEESND